MKKLGFKYSYSKATGGKLDEKLRGRGRRGAPERRKSELFKRKYAADLENTRLLIKLIWTHLAQNTSVKR